MTNLTQALFEVNGYKIIESMLCVEPTGQYEDVEVKRTWKERLSWPFKFWITKKTIRREIMKPVMILDHLNRILYSHPSEIPKLREAMDRANSLLQAGG